MEVPQAQLFLGDNSPKPILRQSLTESSLKNRSRIAFFRKPRVGAFSRTPDYLQRFIRKGAFSEALTALGKPQDAPLLHIRCVFWAISYFFLAVQAVVMNVNTALLLIY